MGVVQFVQVRGAADGAQHGLRAGCEADPGELSESGSHLHQVRRFRISCDFVMQGLSELTDVGHSMTAAYLDTQPHLLGKWASLNPMGRIGRPDELRGVVTWLASDASTFCTGSE